MDKNGKSRHSVWLSDEVWQEVDAFYKLDNCPTRNEFVEKALRQYCGRLHAERTSAYLSHALQEMLEGTLGVFGDRLGKLLFKLVVEHNMTNHLLGGDIDMTRDEYRQRWSANTEKTYSVGEIVPIAPDFVGYNLAAEGYMLQVNRFEIVDYRAYTSALQYDGTDRSRIPDKIALVSVTVSQQNSSAEGFPLTELSLYTTDMLMNMDWDLLGVVNPILDGATGIRLQDGASCDILLPFDLYRYRFTSSEWNGLEQSSIWLQVTNYPTRKIIQVNIGEE